MRKISNHFEWDVRYAVRSQGIKTQAKFFELLSYREADHNKEKSNKISQYEKKPEKKNSSPAPGPSQSKPSSQPDGQNRTTLKGPYPKQTHQKTVQALEKETQKKKNKGSKEAQQIDSQKLQIDVRELDRKMDEYIKNFAKEDQEN